ncbi:TPA: hypothetical protein IAB95_02100, partial [Candidatus Ventrenecus avicola]|nr:hypothetical protein [Candidatus Ventrenecus avicola]
LLLIQHQFVWLYHDDYAYASLSYVDIGNVGNQFGLGKLFEFLFVHYMKWGGRILCFFVECSLLRFGLPVYRFVQSLVIVFIFYFIYKILLSKTKLKDYQLAFLVISMYGFLDIMLLRNSIFWASASVSYLFPLLPFFALVYVTQKKSKNYIISASILGFFAAFSQEQIAAMTIAYNIFYILIEWFFKKRKDKKQFIFFVFSLLGFCILMLAPGNQMRLDTTSSFANLNLFQKLMTTVPAIISGVFATYNGMFLTLFFIVVFIISFINLTKYRSNFFVKLCSISNFIVVLLSLFMENNNYFTYFTSMTTNSTILFLINLIYLFQLLGVILSVCYYFYKEKKFLFMELFLAGLVSLAVMLFAPYYPPRSSIPFIFVMFVPIIYIIGNVIAKVPKLSNILIFTLCIIAFINYATIVRGYFKNNEVNQYNDSLLVASSKKIQNGDEIDTIILKKLHDPTYGGDMPYYENCEYILEWMKNYYSIPRDVDIIYEG